MLRRKRVKASGVGGTKPIRLAAIASTIVALLLSVAPANATDVGNFCDPGLRPDAIAAQGSVSQLPLHYLLWMPAYAKRCRLAAGSIDYRGTSDISGASALEARPPQAAFIGRDVALAPDERALAEYGIAKLLPPFGISNVHQIPMYVTGLAVAYNLDCGKQAVQLSNKTLGLIFAGVITQWNDSSILQDNPSNSALTNCTRTIHVAVRSDDSGASLIFKDYLGKKLPLYRPFDEPQLGTAWPASLNISCKGYGDAGVGGCVIARRGTIGYVSIPVSKRMRLKSIAVENASGEYVKPSMQGCQSAAQNATLPASTTDDWSSTTITYSRAGYGICNFGFVDTFEDFGGAYLVGANLTREAVRNVRDYLQWSLSAGVQSRLPAFGYGSLPPNALTLARAGVADIHWNCSGRCATN